MLEERGILRSLFFPLMKQTGLLLYPCLMPFYHHINNVSPTPTANETLGIIVDGELFAGSDLRDLVFTSSA
jgi:hypothetical protein